MINTSQADRRLHGIELSLKDLVALKVYAKSLQLKSNKKTSANLTGSQVALTQGRGMDFSEVRSYQAGDDIRSIDWRVTARTGKPHTKLFREEREQPVYLFLNLTSSMQFGTRVTFKSIIAAQVAALLAWQTTLNKDRVGGFIYNDSISYFSKSNAGNHGVLPFLKKIIELNNVTTRETLQSSPGFDDLIKYNSLLKHGNKFFIISDFINFSEKEQEFYTRLSKSNQLQFIHIYDVLEEAAPKPNLYSVTNGKNIYRFDSSSLAFQQQYQQSHHEHLATVRRFCSQRKINFTSIRTDADVITALQGAK